MKKAHLNNLILKIICIIIAAVIFFFLKPHTGDRGKLLAFLFGFILPTFTFYLIYLAQNKKKLSTESNLPAFASVFLFLSVYFAGFLIFAKVYGIKAIPIWEWLSLGMAIDLMWIKIFIDSEDSKNISYPLIASGFLAIAFNFSQILSSWHFISQPEGVWISPILLLAIIASYIITLPFFKYEKENTIVSYLYIFISSILFLILSCLAINRLLNKHTYFIPVLISTITGIIITLLLQLEKDKKKNLSLAALILIILIGCFWSAFKFASGFGISLASLCLFFIAIPMTIKSVSAKDEFFKKNSEIILLCGITAVLYASLRIYLQISELYYRGIILGDESFLTGIFIGSFLGLFIESGVFFDIRQKAPFFKKIETFIMLFLFTTLAIFASSVFLYDIGMIGVIIGITIFSLLSIIVHTAEKEPFWNYHLAPLWIIFSLASILSYPLLQIITKFTRLEKIEIIILLTIIAIIVHIISFKKQTELH